MPSKSTADEGDVCCYDKGEVLGKCSQLAPYFNMLNSECYALRENCKKAAGGSDYCLRCAGVCPKS